MPEKKTHRANKLHPYQAFQDLDQFADENLFEMLAVLKILQFMTIMKAVELFLKWITERAVQESSFHVHLQNFSPEARFEFGLRFIDSHFASRRERAPTSKPYFHPNSFVFLSTGLLTVVCLVAT